MIERDALPSEEWLSHLGRDIPAIVWETALTPDLRSSHFTFLSDSAERILRYSRDELLRMDTWERMVHPDDTDYFRHQVGNFFRSGDRATIQHRVITGDGRTMPIEATITLVRDNDGVPIAMRGVTMDISERYQNIRRWQLLVEVGKRFGESIDYKAALKESLNMLVPEMADICQVFLVRPPEGMERILLTAATPELASLAREGLERFTARSDTRVMVFQALEAKQSFLLPYITDDFRKEHSVSPEHFEHMQRMDVRSAILTPLFVGEEMFGVIALSRCGEQARYSEADKLFVEEFARLVSFAIHKARLASEAQAEMDRRRIAEERIDFLASASARFASTLDTEEALKELSRSLVPHVADLCIIMLAEPGQEIRPVAFDSRSKETIDAITRVYREFPIPTDSPFGLQHVLRTGRPEIYLEYNDQLLQQFATSDEHLQVLRSLQFASSALIPVVAHSKTFGAILLACTAESGRTFDPETITFFEEVARRTAFALYKLMLLKEAKSEIERRAKLQSRLELVEEVSRCISGSLDLQELLGQVAAAIAPRFADWLTVDLLKEANEFERVYLYHSDPELRSAAESYRLAFSEETAALREIVERGDPIFIPAAQEADTARFGLSPKRWAAIQQLGASSLIMIPLCSRRRTLGVLGLDYGHSGRHYTLEDVELAMELASRIAAGIDNAILFEESQTELRRRIELQKSLEEAKEAVEVASRAKDQFIAALSHELRTPLTPVLATVELLSEDKDFPESLLPFVDVVRRNIEIEARLIDDLLDMTRITKGKLHLQETDVDLHALIPDVIEICRKELDRHGLHLVSRLRATHPYVRGDRDRLSQVFWNLLHNATKFTPESGLVTIQTRNDEVGRITIEVQDTGRGINPKELRQIFEPFEQRAELQSGLYGGLGLGLSISKSIVEMHGGTIEARSEGAGKGATFIVRLATTEIHSRVQTKPSVQLKPQRTGTILMVDDHIDTNSALKVLLERRGYRVITAGCVAEGIELARQQEFDLLVSDIGLPDGDGIDLLTAIRTECSIPAIALSGYGTDADIERSRKAGFQYHLKKPVAFPDLERAIAELIQ